MNRTQIKTLLETAAINSTALDAIYNVLLFLNQISDEALPTSILLCGFDGEVSLFWDNHDNMFLDVGFDNELEYEYEGHCNNFQFDNTGTIGDPIPSDLKLFLIRFANQKS